MIVLSLAVGAKPVPLGTALDALFRFDPANPDHLVVATMRVPRTELGPLARSNPSGRAG